MAEHDVAQQAPAGPDTSPAQPHRASADPGDTQPSSDVDSRVAELEDKWRRSVAELDNFRKRVARERGAERADERSRVAARWLPVIDNLDLALSHADADTSAVVQGIRAVREQALAILADLGFPRREDMGKTFDPAQHEAVGTMVDDDAPAGTVVQVARPGYGPDERLLRPAGVVVSTRS